jgi:uncharacterized OB-fold protein
MMDVWRNPNDTFVRTWESRFILGEGYLKHIEEVVTGLLEKHSLKTEDVKKAIIPAPDLRSHRTVVRQLGFAAESQVQDPLLSLVGYCGTPHFLIMLTAALEEASPGDLLLVCAYGDGADAMLFEATEKVKEQGNQQKLRELMARKLELSSYARFLSYKGLVETLPGEPFRLFPSATATWRDRNSIIRCHGSRCHHCGKTTFPIQRVCYECGAKDNFDEQRISDMDGKVFTFTRDNLAGRSDDPVVIQTIAEMGEEKVRFYGMMTDCNPSDVKIGMPVRLTFRRIYDGAGMHNYFWKCKPSGNRRS